MASDYLKNFYSGYEDYKNKLYPSIGGAPIGPGTPGLGAPVMPPPVAVEPAQTAIEPPGPNVPPAPDIMDRISTGFRNPAIQGLTTMGLSMLATPPRAQPYSDLEVLGRGGLAGMHAMNDAYKSQDAMGVAGIKNYLETVKIAETGRHNLATEGAPMSLGGGVGYDKKTGALIGTPKEQQSDISKKLTDVYGKEAVAGFTAAEKVSKYQELLGNTSQSHNVIEMTAPDGKSAQKMQYNPTSKQYDIPVGQPYKTKSQVINITTAKSDAEGFKSWQTPAKDNAFMFNALTGKPPASAAGMGGTDRKIYAKEYAQWQVDKGFKAQDIALMQADYKAGDMSLKNMKKQEAPMEAFVGNINKQISKVEQLYKSGDRVGLRLIDLPLRELRVKAQGSGDEAVKASYLLEISNEIGKLSSGASASVQQLSDSAKEDWKKVHDPNLSTKEIMKVVNATRDQANMRLSTWKDAGQVVRKNIQELGNQGAGGAGGGVDLDAINAEIERRKGQK